MPSIVPLDDQEKMYNYLFVQNKTAAETARILGKQPQTVQNFKQRWKGFTRTDPEKVKHFRVQMMLRQFDTENMKFVELEALRNICAKVVDGDDAMSRWAFKNFKKKPKTSAGPHNDDDDELGGAFHTK